MNVTAMEELELNDWDVSTAAVQNRIRLGCTESCFRNRTLTLTLRSRELTETRS